MLENEAIEHTRDFLLVDIVLIVGAMEGVVEGGCEGQIGISLCGVGVFRFLDFAITF
jgi:hypothetical protein